MPMPSETAGNGPKQEDGQSIRAKDKPEQTFSLMIWLGLPCKILGQRPCVEIGRTAISTIWTDNLRRCLPGKEDFYDLEDYYGD